MLLGFPFVYYIIVDIRLYVINSFGIHINNQFVLIKILFSPYMAIIPTITLCQAN